ncbi:SCO1860 family LAETG-anchored protein [Streptacidiphilus sp. MAP5-3]|uniref:SCO1860 family LAETG-anchored protein n=1 Tax=unclassified Streptacidiphilus TaxID=2643834 RepID=UPI003511587F
MFTRRRFATPFALSGALAAVSMLGVATPAHADGGSGGGIGTASATTAEAALDVRLLNGAIDVPIDVSLNRITAPSSKQDTALTAVVGGVGGPGRRQPVNLLLAKVGESSATADAHGSHASVTLAEAHLHLPGLPLTELLGLQAVTATADCPANGAPTAEANVLGEITVLGLHVHLSASGETRVPVPALGEVDLWLSKHSTTSDSAAATALDLEVSVNPLNLNVAAVTGKFLLADVSCTKGDGSGGGDSGGGTGGSGGSSGGGTPSGGPSSSSPAQASGGSAGGGSTRGVTGGGGGQPTPGSSASAASGSGGSGTGTGSGTGSDASDTTTGHLAETGSSSATPAIAGGALLLLGAGAGAVTLTRRRRRD